MEITIKIDQRKKEGQALLEFLKSLPFVEIEETKSPYDPDFVKMVKKSKASKNRTRVTSKSLWESI